MAIGDHTIDINGTRVPFGLCSTIVGALSVYQNARERLRARDTLTWTFECGTCGPVVARRATKVTDVTWPNGHACAQLAARSECSCD